MVQLLDMLHVVSLDTITRIVHGKFNCITVNFEKTQYNDTELINNSFANNLKMVR